MTAISSLPALGCYKLQKPDSGDGGIFINRQHDVFFMHLRNVAAQKMWSHFTRFVFFSISLHSGPALFEAPSKRIIMAYPQCVHDHYIYFLGVVQLATRKKLTEQRHAPTSLLTFFCKTTYIQLYETRKSRSTSDILF